MEIPASYEARLLTKAERVGWFNWSLDFFTEEPERQNPYVDITLQLNVTTAYQHYLQQAQGGSFFSFLVWHFMQVLKKHLSFRLRLIENDWYVIDNPSVFIPVAVSGQQRFVDLIIQNVMQMDYTEFTAHYSEQLQMARDGKGPRVTPEMYFLTQFFGNLPNLQFTGLTLHSRHHAITGQNYFYFGKRYFVEQQLFIPFAAKLHHACTDPFVLDQLLQDFQQHMQNL